MGTKLVRDPDTKKVKKSDTTMVRKMQESLSYAVFYLKRVR